MRRQTKPAKPGKPVPPMSKAYELARAQQALGRTIDQVAEEIGYSRPALSRYLSGTYGDGVQNIETALLKAYDQRICPGDGEVKRPEHCRRIAPGPRPHGFPDADALWLVCQTCAHRPPTPNSTEK